MPKERALNVKSADKRLENLRSERSSFLDLWRELSEHHLAHRGRFLTSDRNKGHKRNTKQYNNSSRLASRTLASGMMAGITSPARPWFRLGTGDPDLNEFASVKQWLNRVESIMYRVFSSSNTYNSLHTLYAEMGVFGTGAMGVYKDFDNVIRCKTYTVGGYFLAMNGRDEVDTFYRECEKTVAECVSEFGEENCSQSVRDRWRAGNLESKVKVVHFVEPNDNRDNTSPLAKDKRYRSVWYEQGAVNSAESKFLRRSGFDMFPVLTPRWDVADGDVYSVDSPGMTAIGDVKAMQLYERRKAQAIDKLANPPLQGPATLVNKAKNAASGEMIARSDSNDKLESIYGANYNPRINEIRQEINECENRVSRAFYEDLFLMLANSDRRQITAREVAEKHEEKLLMLGPVLERLHNELLDPLIDRTFEILQQSGVLPLPPEELQGRELNVEYVSVLAQAQRMVAVTGIERVTTFAGSMANLWPDARHKIDPSQAIDDYAEAVGVNPSVVRPDEDVRQMAQAEQQAQAQQAALDQAQQVASTASSVVDMDPEALNNLVRNAGLA